MTTFTIHRELPSPLPPRRAMTVTMFAVCGAAIVLSLLVHRYYGTFIRGSDAQMYYAQVRSLVIDGDLTFDNEITQLSPNREVFYDSAGELRVALTPDGHVSNKHAFGWALLSLPAFALAHALQTVTGGDTSGYSTVYSVTVGLWHLAFVLLSLWLLARAASRLVDPRAAVLAAAGIFFATNLVYYTCVYPTMSHAASFAAVAIALALAIALHDDPWNRRRWIGAGLLTGLVALLRPTDVVLFIAFLPAVIRTWKRDDTGSRAALPRWFAPLCLVAGVVLAVLLQLVIWRISYGSWITNAYDLPGVGFQWGQPALPHVLTSTHHGAWYFHPLLLIGFIGLLIAAVSRNSNAASHRALWLALLAGYLLHVYVHACWYDWAFSHSFGHRMFVNSAPVIMLGLAKLLDGLSKMKRRVAYAGIAALIAWNLLLVASFIKGHIPAVGHVTPGELMAAQVRTLTGAGAPSR